MKKFITKSHWVLSAQFGINLKFLILAVLGLPRYINDLVFFIKRYNGKIEFMPCLHDRYEEGGTTDTEYFWQDLYVAQQIFKSAPHRHLDIGSRVDGFVAHVASFRQIEICDIRKIDSDIPNVTFIQADLMKPLIGFNDYCDSLSCLHALEHFGLGRYGDQIDVDGYEAGLRNMANLLSKNGTFYLATPVGIPKVAFNAHRVFDPKLIKTILVNMGFELTKFAWFGDEKMIIESTNIELDIENLAIRDYSLGIFTFVKH